MAGERRGLPVPREGMTPEEKGALPMRYVAWGVPVEGLQSEEATPAGAELGEVNLVAVVLSHRRCLPARA